MRKRHKRTDRAAGADDPGGFKGRTFKRKCGNDERRIQAFYGKMRLHRKSRGVTFQGKDNNSFQNGFNFKRNKISALMNMNHYKTNSNSYRLISDNYFQNANLMNNKNKLSG